VNSKRSTILTPNPLALPDLGLTDFTLWQDVLDHLDKGAALDSNTDKLADVKDAPHEYKVECSQSNGQCPPPFGGTMGSYFNAVGLLPALSAWYDDDSVLRRLDVTGSVLWDRRAPGGNAPGTEWHGPGEYVYHLSFTLSDFGGAVAIPAPATDRVSESKLVRLKS
jgi:hypothetical protein